ncbi:hypothetical protein Tco_0649097 [Tanacetum coccineum]
MKFAKNGKPYGALTSPRKFCLCNSGLVGMLGLNVALGLGPTAQSLASYMISKGKSQSEAMKLEPGVNFILRSQIVHPSWSNVHLFPRERSIKERRTFQTINKTSSGDAVGERNSLRKSGKFKNHTGLVKAGRLRFIQNGERHKDDACTDIGICRRAFAKLSSKWRFRKISINFEARRSSFSQSFSLLALEGEKHSLDNLAEWTWSYGKLELEKSEENQEVEFGLRPSEVAQQTRDETAYGRRARTSLLKTMDALLRD